MPDRWDAPPPSWRGHARPSCAGHISPDFPPHVGSSHPEILPDPPARCMPTLSAPEVIFAQVARDREDSMTIRAGYPRAQTAAERAGHDATKSPQTRRWHRDPTDPSDPWKTFPSGGPGQCSRIPRGLQPGWSLAAQPTRGRIEDAQTPVCHLAIILETAVEEDFKTREGPSHPGGWAHGQEPKGSPCE